MIAAFFPKHFSIGLLLVASLFLAGCGTSDVVVRPVFIAGGKLVGIPFGPHGPMPGKADGYLVEYAATVPGAVATQLIYKFAFVAPPATSLKHVVVDDISDEQSGTLIDDQNPWLEENRWHAETRPYEVKDPLLAWAFTVTPSLRVYRFTITDAAGKQTILYQVTGYPEFMKAAMRSSWGEKY